MTSALDIDVLPNGCIHVLGQIVVRRLDPSSKDGRLVALEILVVFHVIGRQDKGCLLFCRHWCVCERL